MVVSEPSYIVPPLIAVVTTLFLLAIALIWSRRDFTVGLFCSFLVSLAIWNLLVFGQRISPDVQHAVYWSRAMIVPSMATFVLYYHFSLIYTGARGQKWLLRAAYLCLILFAVLAPTGIFIESMRIEDFGYAPNMGMGSYLLLPIGPLLIIAGAINLLRGYKLCRTHEERQRLVYLAIAAAFPLAGGLIDAFTNLPPVAVWSNLVFSILCSIAVLRYHLLDVRIFIRRSLVYLLVSAVVAIPYVSILLLINRFLGPIADTWWIYAIMLLLLAIILRPLYSWAQNVVDRLFYRDRYDYLKALEQFSRETQNITNLKELSSTLTQLVSGALHTSSVCLLLSSESANGLVLVSCTGLSNPPSGVVLKNRSPLTKLLKIRQHILSSEEFNTIPQLQSLSPREKNNLEQMEAKLYVPLQTAPGQLSGILVLGQKLSQQPYFNEDRQLLKALSSQMAIALENARLYNESQQEVKERKRAEQVLQENEEFLSSMLTNFPNPIEVVNPDNSIRYVNPALEELTGFTSAELVGRKPPYPYWTEETLQRTSRDFEEAIARAVRLEELFERKNGERFWVEITSRPITYNGEFKYYLSNWIDITGRKLTVQALRSSEAKYRGLVTNVKLGVFRSTPELAGRFLEVNPAMEEITGYSREELLKMDVSDLYVNPEERKVILEEIASGGGKPTREANLRKKDGTEIVISDTKVAVRNDSGKVIYFDGIMEDITERKRAEGKEKELQQELDRASRLAAVGELAAGVAHEVNNPLTGIMGFSERLLRKSGEDDTRETVDIIHREAQRAAKVVRNLLTFARQREPAKEYADINDIMQKTLELRAYELKSGNIEVALDLAANLPKVMVDFHQIQEVFLNIILNAEQAMIRANGGGRLIIKTKEIDSNIGISFTDDGPGIPAEHLEKVFNPFFTTKGERGGTGLGLSACHGIVTEHGGRIYARSKPGNGATFFVELPVVIKKAYKNGVTTSSGMQVFEKS